MKQVQQIIEWLWLAVAVISLAVFIYIWIAEGLVAGKAWTFLISLAIGLVMWRVRRKQRLTSL